MGAAPLARRDTDRARPPIEVLETELCHLSRAHAEPDEAEGNGVVALSDGAAGVE